MSKIRVAEGVRSQADDTGATLLDSKRGIFLSLNVLGLKIWNELQHGSSRDQIIDNVCRQFPRESERIAGDVESFLGSLKQHGLIEEEE